MFRILLCLLSLSPLVLKAQTSTTDFIGEAYSYYQNQQYEEALTYYDSAFAEGNNYCIDLYNASCCAALLEDSLRGYGYLYRSIDQGYVDLYWLDKDADMDYLKSFDAGWQRVLTKVQQKIKMIETQLSVLKSYKSDDIIPYCKNRKWGYYAKASGKILVQPQFLSLSFIGNTAVAKMPDDCELYFKKDGSVYKIVSSEEETLVETAHYLEPQLILNNNGAFKGFHLDASKKYVVSYSDLYNRYLGDHKYNISDPILIEGNYYVVVCKSSEGYAYGIIDSLGNPLPHFNFCYNYIQLNPAAKGTQKWFICSDYVTDFFGFVNEKGIRWKDENLVSTPSYYDLQYGYGYNIQAGVTKSNEYKAGILDAQEMKWIVKPFLVSKLYQYGNIESVRNNAGMLGFTFIGNYESRCRENITGIYLLIEQGDNRFYVDAELNKLWPKE